MVIYGIDALVDTVRRLASVRSPADKPITNLVIDGLGTDAYIQDIEVGTHPTTKERVVVLCIGIEGAGRYDTCIHCGRKQEPGWCRCPFHAEEPGGSTSTWPERTLGA